MISPDSNSDDGDKTHANAILMRWVSRLEQRSREANALFELNGLLQSAVSLEEACEIAASRLERLMPGWSGFVGWRQRGSETIRIQARWGGYRSPHLEFPLGHCERLLNPGSDVDGSLRQTETCSHLLDVPDASPRICIPVLSNDDLLGLITLLLYAPRSGEPYLTSPALTQARIDLLKVVASQLGGTLRDIEDHQAARSLVPIDRQSRLTNRRNIEEILEKERQNARLTNTSFSLLFFSLRSSREPFAPSAEPHSGDMIKKIGAMLISNIRKEDIAAVAGPDLFLVVLKNTNADQALRVAKRISTMVTTIPPAEGEHYLPKPAVGLVVFSSEANDALDPLLEAETALEDARSKGPGKIHLKVCD